MSVTEAPEARPGEVEFTLSWRAENGCLRGELEALNVSDHEVRLSHKPALIPIGVDGQPLEAETAVTLELRRPPYVEFGPGERARTDVGWAGWAGPSASGRVLVAWQGGQVEVTAEGPREPESDGPATNLWTSWFERK